MSEAGEEINGDSLKENTQPLREDLVSGNCNL
jgi:hypothetical protein